MTTLVIHTPDYRVRKPWPKSFEEVLLDGIGQGYAIYEKYISVLTPGCRVVLLRKDKNKKRAEGILVIPPVPTKLPTNKYTPQGIRRYDVYIKGLTEVSYKPEKLNRFGIAII